MNALRTAQVVESIAVRALLDVSRQDVEDFCEERGVPSSLLEHAGILDGVRALVPVVLRELKVAEMEEAARAR